MANLFPKATNLIVIRAGAALGLVGTLAALAVWYYFTPKYSRVGYQPVQPVAFQHNLHVGQLGLDCRYCHSFVEKSGFSNYPTTQTCMNCHATIQKDNPRLAPVRDSWATGKPIEWVKVHNVPDYAYFNHSAHVNRGVSCVSCHGQVNEMNVVFQDQSQSMGWCLSCHRHPENAVRPIAADKPGDTSPIYNLKWKPPDGTTQAQLGAKLVHDWKIDPPTDCAGCHR
jgi:Cytochrome c7 and related cytochrome c/Class III cytochrome C family